MSLHRFKSFARCQKDQTSHPSHPVDSCFQPTGRGPEHLAPRTSAAEALPGVARAPAAGYATGMLRKQIEVAACRNKTTCRVHTPNIL